MFQKSNIVKGKSILLLAIFVLLKMGIAHAVSHGFSHDDDDVADCDDCFVIFDSNKENLFDYQGDTYVEATSFIKSSHKPIILLYKNPIITVYRFTQFFNRPPPSVA